VFFGRGVVWGGLEGKVSSGFLFGGLVFCGVLGFGGVGSFLVG